MSYCNLGRYGIAVPATALLALMGAGAAEASAVIDNGTVAPGVNDQGNLIFADVGLTFLSSLQAARMR